MSILSIDLETYGDLDLSNVGVYRYAEACEILLFAYAWDEEPVRIVDMANGETIPDDVLKALDDENIRKTAYNAAFERVVLSAWLGYRLKPEGWSCTMVLGYNLGLPGGLDNLGKAINLAEDKQKLSIGKRLIQYFSKPCRPTKSNNGRTRNLPEHDVEKWEMFKTYCMQDVESERAIRKKLMNVIKGENPKEYALWCLDQRINDLGVCVDITLIASALRINEKLTNEWLDEARRRTLIENPNSRSQILGWINAKTGRDYQVFDKAARAEMLADSSLPNDVRRVIELKELLGKTSISKYEAMDRSMCSDGRVHGMLQFYGASRTGRWAGRLVQVQNLPQNHLDDLDADRLMVRDCRSDSDYKDLKMVYDNPSDVLSQLIRTAFIAPKNSRFIVADFSAIEARVIAWLADEQWRMDTFAKGGDIYCASASQMFHVPVVKHGENGHLRQKGKIAELACGYGGGVNALKAFGADKMGMSQSEMESTIKQWREASPRICKLWSDVEKCAKKAIRITGNTIDYKKGISFLRRHGFLFIRLPSGRTLAYPMPRIKTEDMGDWTKESICYNESVNGQWLTNYTWGGKLVENIVQAIARDCLAHSMLELDKLGYWIVMHIHDEVVIEAPNEIGSLNEVCEVMGKEIPWAKGLLLKAEGYETRYYKKD